MTLIEEAHHFLEARARRQPRVGVVLGSGLGGFAEELEDRLVVPYQDIPHWPRPSAVGHAGQLVFGEVEGQPVAVMSGRVHLYEGHAPSQVVFGVRVLARLGIRALALTCAAGGINLAYQRGGLVLISDHINLQGVNPLAGPNDEALGPRFPDMSEAYSPRLRALAREVAAQQGIALEEGVYAAMLGPSFETPAEIRYLRAVGADLVGMSTAPEVIAANHMGVEVVALACVTNMAAGILPQKLSHVEVLETGEMVRETLVRFLKALLPRLEV
ncbi:MAG: purine-nucleoside phosphorylase [Acidobacteria bacterium]|nr:purine-nucleoside phosphorylase [Acidobacteriota bacterium]